MFYIIKKKKYVQLIFNKANSNCEKRIILLIIPNKEKEGRHYLAVKKIICIITRNNLLELSSFF